MTNKDLTEIIEHINKWAVDYVNEIADDPWANGRNIDRSHGAITAITDLQNFLHSLPEYAPIKEGNI